MSAETEKKPAKKRVRSPVHADSNAGDLEKSDRKLSNDDMARILELIATNPDNVVRKLAKAEGFPYLATEKFINRLRVNHVGLTNAVKTRSRAQEIETMSEKISRILDYMDDYTLANADLKDLAIAFGILAEKRQLMEGRPTQILTFEERRQMPELLGAALREAKRRGLNIDATAVEVQEVPMPMVLTADVTPEEALSHTARTAAGKHNPAEER